MKRLATLALLVFPSLAIAQSNNGLAQQVAALETRIIQAETRLAAAETRLSSAESRVSALTTENSVQAVKILALQADVVPVGTIIAFSAETPPAGFLECNGSQISRTDFAALFATIGTAFGAGDGSTTFHLPELRGLFLRGWAHAQLLEPFSWDPDLIQRYPLNSGGASGDHVGSLQDHLLASHNHSVMAGVLNPFGSFMGIAGGNAVGPVERFTEYTAGNETRPVNVAVLYAIKY